MPIVSPKIPFCGGIVAAAMVAAALSALSLAGCVSPALPPPRPVAAASPEDYLARSQALAQTEGPRNYVLNQMRAGTVAFGMGRDDLATQAFDAVVTDVLSIYADNPSAAKARKLWHEEATKNFKGEPYERAMALFFRGLLYYREADYDNARACFRSAQFQDALAEEDQNRSDFIAMDWFEALCNVRLGQAEEARDVLRHARTTSRPIPSRLPEIDPDSNVVFVLLVGPAPVKEAAGRNAEKLVIRPGQTNISGVRARLDGAPFRPEWLFDSVSYQATTRGGRAVDYILGRKAAYKMAGKAVAGVGEAAGAGMIAYGLSDDKKDVAAAGAGVLALGLLADAAASRIQPRADTRAWDTLPDALFAGAAKLAPGKHEIEAIYTDAAGNPVYPEPQRIAFEVPPAPAKNTLVTLWSNPPSCGM